MKNCIRLTLVLALLCAAMSTAALAAENSYLYLVHGIPGLDYSSTTDPEFPVDVLLNDEVCYARGLAFGTISGPLTLAPGSYSVKISVANALAPCTTSPLLDSTVTLNGGENLSAVFALDSTGAPSLQTFVNSFRPVTTGDGRVLFALAADSPAVQVVLENTSTQKSYKYTVNPAALLNTSVPSGNYTIEVTEGSTTLVPSTALNLSSQSVTMIFAIGEASNNSVVIETKTIKDVL